MELDEIEFLVQEAFGRGLLFRSEGTVLSSAEGFNYAARAVLGAMVVNLGQQQFNSYFRNQKTLVGWLGSKSDPISARARKLKKARSTDPTVRSMLNDVEGEFVAPLVGEHTRRGGTRPSNDEIEATCAMLVSKILWDLELGNPDLSKYLHYAAQLT